MVLFFTITPGHFLCWVLVMLLLDRYHVAVMNVQGNWIIHLTENNIITIKIGKKVNINSVFMAHHRVVEKLANIFCIDSKKTHKATNYDINVHIEQSDIKNMYLNIGRDVSDKDYGSIYTIENKIKLDIILLNGQVIVILFSILIRY